MKRPHLFSSGKPPSKTKAQTRSSLRRWIARTITRSIVLPFGLGLFSVAVAQTDFDKKIALEDAYFEENYSELITEATTYLDGAPEDHDIRFLRGMAYSFVGELQQAQTDIQTALEGGTMHDAEARLMLKNLSSLRSSVDSSSDAGKPPAAKPFSYNVSLGIHSDTRVLIRPKERDPEPVEDIEDQAAQLKLLLRFQSKRGLFASYFNNALFYNEATDENRLTQNMVIGYRHKGKRSIQDIGLLGNSILLDGDEYRRRYGVQANILGSLTTNVAVWAGAEVGQDEFPEYEEYDGDYASLRLGALRFWGPMRLTLDGSYTDHSARLDEVGYTETSVGLGAEMQIHKRVDVGIHGRYTDNPYDKFDDAFDLKRKDQYLTGRLFGRYHIRSGFSIEPSATYIQRDSNVDTLEYDRWVLELNTVLWSW